MRTIALKCVLVSAVVWQELRERGMTVSGKKEDLAMRLLDSMKAARHEAGTFENGGGYEDTEQEVRLAENLNPDEVAYLTVRPAPEAPPVDILQVCCP